MSTIPNTNPYPIDENLTAIAIGFKNNDMIADLVLPRTSVMGKDHFAYQYYAPEQFMTVPDTHVGRKSRVNQVEFNGEKRHGKLEHYGLEHPLPYADLNNAADTQSIKGNIAGWLSGLILLDREVRVARTVFNPTTYGVNTTALSAADAIDVDGVNPIKTILNIFKGMPIRPNTMILGEKEWLALSTNPFVLAMVMRSTGNMGVGIQTAGVLSVDEVKRLLQLKNVYVGQGLISNGKEGNVSYAWGGGNIAFMYQDEQAVRIAGSVDLSAMTFGFSPFNGKVASTWDDRNIGLEGGQMVRVGDKVSEVICAPNLGFLLTNVLKDA